MKYTARNSTRTPCAGGTIRRGSLIGWIAAAGMFVFGLAVGSAAAQAPEDAAVPTLHAYTDLVQVPTLVLSRINFRPETRIEERKFSVSFDGGPKFHVTHARLEGDDPLSVAILLDSNRVSPKVADEAIASLAPLSLHANDTVTLFGMDCQAVQAPEGPADASALKRRVGLLLSWEDERDKETAKAKCQNPATLMDTLAVMVQTLSSRPGRRVILAITDGLDRGSHTSWSDLRHFAQSKSVTIFGLMSPPAFTTANSGRLTAPFNAVCESSGGIVLLASGPDLAKELAWAITLVRSRYILEFPRPMSTADGLHNIQVTIAEGEMFIRPAGASFPSLNPNAFKEPGSIVSDPALRPQLGKHKLPSSQPSDVAAIAPTPPAAQAADPQASAVSSTPTPTQTVAEPVIQPAAPAPPSSSTAAAAPSALARPSTAPSSAASTLKVSTRLTLENITVTDSKGHPVHGLTEADFSIKEDGKLQPIRNFEEYGSEKPQLPTGASADRPQATATASAVGILMFDNVSTGFMNGLRQKPEYFMIARQQALKFLQEMPAATKVAVLDLTDELKVVQGFTSDRELLLKAVNSIPSSLVAMTYDPHSAAEACAIGNRQSRFALEGLNRAAAFVSGIPGRKNLIWLTPGTPWLTDYSQFLRDHPGATCLADYSLDLHRAYDLLTAEQVALYPLDPRGLFSNPSVGGAAAGAPGNGGEMAFLVATREDQGSLDGMAKATGGVAYFNRNDLSAAIGEAIVTGSEYYSISYVPPLSKYDGKHHRIEIKVDRPGLTLHYRTGYDSDDPEKVARSH
jgi:VWFA-related protein